eukprot:TRINITY_DN5695_c0_g2_i9.p6 TRINITY_DN5695_c0_g2~~TRINITY_DN5695_c0_g2_i9.p6  ORF type:complete len:190 (+),score=-5.22 TRINITY_DN5695_c0_g2_i9:1187-1756(+)
MTLFKQSVYLKYNIIIVVTKYNTITVVTKKKYPSQSNFPCKDNTVFGYCKETPKNKMKNSVQCIHANINIFCSPLIPQISCSNVITQLISNFKYLAKNLQQFHKQLKMWRHIFKYSSLKILRKNELLLFQTLKQEILDFVSTKISHQQEDSFKRKFSHAVDFTNLKVIIYINFFYYYNQNNNQTNYTIP